MTWRKLRVPGAIAKATNKNPRGSGRGGDGDVNGGGDADVNGGGDGDGDVSGGDVTGGGDGGVERGVGVRTRW